MRRMRADGVRPAALLVDTIFASDGVVAHPAGFLAEAVRHVREAGALFIADEVQPGFGRVGEAMWGFQRHGVIPDLVTMGKPMGNGHPVAAVAGQPGVLAAFAQRTRYFNTYGGNSVSCAAALAVLQVIREQQLLKNALASGAYLQRRLQRARGTVRRGSARCVARGCSWASSSGRIRRADWPARPRLPG